MDITAYSKNYISNIERSLSSIDSNDLIFFLEKIQNIHANKRRIFFIGNGGSALNAIHFSMGLSYVSKKWSSPIRSFALCDNSSLMSSLSNDYSFDDVYSRQIQVHGEKGDLLVVLSSSGNSKNLVQAVEIAKQLGLETFALLGTNGGNLLSLCDANILISSGQRDAGYAEDIHMIIGHIITTYLEYHWNK